MTNALLLRLFTSEFFNSWIAVSYLFKYSDNVGIQHYLCTELKSFPISEIEFFLPQLIHLLITKPSDSVALECFMVETCEKSTHIALMTLWYLQAYLSDLSMSPTSASFELCKRLLNKTQEIVFAEEPQPNLPKVRENAYPALVGMGAMLLGIGQPLMTKAAGRIPLAQGRRNRAIQQTPPDEPPQTPTPTYLSSSQPDLTTKKKKPGFSPFASSPSLEDLRTRYLKRRSHDISIYDPSLTTLAQSSVPTLPFTTPLAHPTPPVTLLKSNFFRSEMQFLLALVDIATRLVIVPKPARMSALHAELTLLNHNLPAEICLPLWCRGEENHHRILRISPADAVVLNSAERVPYLLMLEVLDETCHELPEPVPVVSRRPSASPVIRVRQEVDGYAERMRTAAVMLSQLQSNKQGEHIRQRIMQEMIALEDQRMAEMKKGVNVAGREELDEQRIAWVVNKEDPSAAVLSENWEVKKNRLRAASPYGHLPNWRLVSVIVKHGSDLRQEQFAIQLIREMQRIWQDIGVDVWVKYYRVLVTSDNSGLIETLRNTVSIHSIKKEAYTRGWNETGTLFTIYDYFIKVYGPPESEEFLKAQDAFMRSLAGYSIVCYLLQIKDRHNGNLLIDDAGHLIHIDFGFMLSNSPGSVGFEMAPFKLPQEYIDILGGIHGEKFAEYKALMKAGFLAVRKHSENILLLTEMMSTQSKLPCFQHGDLTVQQLRDRFQLQLTEPQAEEFVDKLVMSSCCNVFTRLYDTFQYYSQGIL